MATTWSLYTQATIYSFEIGKLPSSQTIGIISLIPKGEKPKEYLDSWRPITLLNSIHKIISGVLAKRINGVLPQIIHPDQFVGLYRVDTLVTVLEQYMTLSNMQKEITKLLLIDFRKAFDSISFKFIEGSFKYFGFKNNPTKQFQSIYKSCRKHFRTISDTTWL